MSERVLETLDFYMLTFYLRPWWLLAIAEIICGWCWNYLCYKLYAENPSFFSCTLRPGTRRSQTSWVQVPTGLIISLFISWDEWIQAFKKHIWKMDPLILWVHSITGHFWPLENPSACWVETYLLEPLPTDPDPVFWMVLQYLHPHDLSYSTLNSGLSVS